MQEYLTDIEVEKIVSLCADVATFEALRKVMLASVYYSGALKKGEKLEPKNQAFDLISRAYQSGKPITNEELGAELRGLFSGVDLVEQGLAQLKTIKTKAKQEVETPYNIAE